jgi:hypothetical protein
VLSKKEYLSTRLNIGCHRKFPRFSLTEVLGSKLPYQY